MTLSSAGALDVTGDITGSTLNADGDTAAGDNAAIGYPAGEGLILTGQGSTNDVTIKNDADADVITIATGGTSVAFPGTVGIGGTLTDGTLHVLTASAGSVASPSDSNDLVVENSGDGGITLLVPDASEAIISAGSPTDNDFWRLGMGYASGSSYQRWLHGATELARMTNGPVFYIGDTVNSNMADGITINQLDNDDHILALKSSDVAHGGPGIFSAEADTYGSFQKNGGATGGLYMSGFSEAQTGLKLAAWVETQPDTTPGTSFTSMPIYNLIGIYEGSDYAFDANAILWGLRKTIAGGSYRTVMLVDEDGDIHLDGTSNNTAFDEEDDALLCRSLDLMRAPKNVIRSEFDRWTQDHKTTLEDTGIISKIDPDNPDHWDEDGNLSDPMINITQLQRLHNGAIWQQRAMFETMKQVAEEMLPGFGAKLNERLVEQKLPALPVPA